MIDLMAECMFCGEDHGPCPVGIKGGPFEGIEFKVCPKLPPDHIYEDREYDTGPRGALHHIGSDPADPKDARS